MLHLLPATAAVLAALGLFAVLYLFTGYYQAAIYHTSINRVALQLMPALAFLTLLIYASLSGLTLKTAQRD